MKAPAASSRAQGAAAGDARNANADGDACSGATSAIPGAAAHTDAAGASTDGAAHTDAAGPGTDDAAHAVAAGPGTDDAAHTDAGVAIARLTRLVEGVLEAAVPPPPPSPDDDATGPARAETFGVSRLVESMRYSLRTPGKRIRPLLFLATAEALGADAAKLARFAAALEMIHAYSLIHDDLPAMDDDDLRRGMPTNHVLFGDGMAILAGDGLLTEAFLLMCAPVAEPALQLRVLEEIARAAGREGMVGGQAAVLMAEGLAGDADLLRAIHARKTGALLRCSVRAAALLAGASDSEVSALTDFGERFGLSFQIADDIKDEIAPTEITGKRVGGDRSSNKTTYPSVYGIERSRELLRMELAAALQALGRVPRDVTVLETVAREAVAPALTGFAWSRRN